MYVCNIYKFKYNLVFNKILLDSSRNIFITFGVCIVTAIEWTRQSTLIFEDGV